MSGFNYAKFQATALRLISKFGGTGTIRRYVATGPDYDPTRTPTDYPCTLYQDMVELTKMAGTLIEANDRRVYVAASNLGITPTTADKWVLGGAEYVIKSAQPLQPDPGAAVIMYEIVFTV